MKRFLLTTFLGMSALFAGAQQWSGSTTTSNEIYRYGQTSIIPTENFQPYMTLTNTSLAIYGSYNGQYLGTTMSLSNNGLSFDIQAPVARNTATIGRGYFTFHCNSNHGNGKDFKLTEDGNLSTDGQISSVDTIRAKDFIATNSVRANDGYFTYVRPNYISVNGATTSSTYKLAVNSGILCEELKVMADVPSSDYVFEKEYELKSLSEVEKFVKENKHLPEIPSAQEFKENGYKVGEMDNLLLQKIEELTLYIIDLQKQIEELKQENHE